MLELERLGLFDRQFDFVQQAGALFQERSRHFGQQLPIALHGIQRGGQIDGALHLRLGGRFRGRDRRLPAVDQSGDLFAQFG